MEEIINMLDAYIEYLEKRITYVSDQYIDGAIDALTKFKEQLLKRFNNVQIPNN